jgi:hypothetical protein
VRAECLSKLIHVAAPMALTKVLTSGTNRIRARGIKTICSKSPKLHAKEWALLMQVYGTTCR